MTRAQWGRGGTSYSRGLQPRSRTVEVIGHPFGQRRVGGAAVKFPVAREGLGLAVRAGPDQLDDGIGVSGGSPERPEENPPRWMGLSSHAINQNPKPVSTGKVKRGIFMGEPMR